MLVFLESGGNESEINALLDIIFKVIQIALLHNFSIQVLKISWLLTLLGSRLRIIFPPSLAENVILDKSLSVRQLGLVGNLL